METEETRKKNTELRKKIEFQVACEERAHRIVERLIDNPVTEEILQNCLPFITQDHYSDIVEERAISKLCGYILCPNNLGNVPKQKFMISTKTNKVYDIESRKNFCSGKCYKASKHIESQISNDPVWSRKNQPMKQFDILSLDMEKGRPGDEVTVTKAKEVKTDLEKLEKLEKYHEQLSERKFKHSTKHQAPMQAEKKNEKGSIDEDITADTCVYTLEKAMDEMKIDSSNVKTGHCNPEADQEQSSEKSSDDGCFITKQRDLKSESVSGQACVEQWTKSEKSDQKGVVDNKSDQVKKSKRGKHVDPKKAKTDYLMQLLDKRKTLLAKMVDIQNDIPQNKSNSKESVRSTTSNEDTHWKDVDNYCDEKNEVTELTVKEIESSTGLIDQKESTIGDETMANPSNCKIVSDKVIAISTEVDTELCADVLTLASEGKNENDTEKSTYCRYKNSKEKEQSKRKDGRNSKRSVNKASILKTVFTGIEAWITDETKKYLKVFSDNENCTDSAKTVFEKKYEELVARVDAQEKDLDALLGEESMETSVGEGSKAPLPHFDVIKEEMATNQLRVQEFMKGSFTYKVTEKQVDMKSEESSGVVLPVVDRYDQLLIRQKIVLERISKVLPDILSPLQLLVQDVFTEMRELVWTFELTSENIIFKPAEWTLVTLILLKMLSRKVTAIQTGFAKPSAEKYFRILLSNLEININQIDNFVDLL